MNRPIRQVKEDEHKINHKIRAPFVRLVGDNIENQGIVSLREALDLADKLDLDLVEISPNAEPPVCKIIDYQKFLYQQKKKQKEMQSNAQKVVIKEIRFGPNTDDHDYAFKLKHAIKFLEEGNKVKAFVFFKGRSIIYKEQGEILLLKLAQDVEDYGKVDQMPKLEGKKMQIIISPKAAKKK
ncbi:MAG: translation initiation factor IF-3 [Bacteroidales bacterium]|nr:translation initiation factor IF-3 [Bacteroidales bacterium]